GYYISTGYKDVPGLLLLLLVLSIKPAGLFGSTAIKKV
ncbi:MAG: branched-chain amino acid ABC transporter permease, partial [Alphaproteobacteria bacterium]|nr:branched-chain amino acid ABC transporter permease [Alphaproteobacteria bacterium]